MERTKSDRAELVAMAVQDQGNSGAEQGLAQEAMMKTVKVKIGQYTRSHDGREYDNCRPVQFVGVQLAKIDYGTDRGRGTTETLYKTAGRLVVHVENWSSWVGEPTTYELHEVSEEMLGPGGPYEFLGRAAGYGRPLTLDEALA